MKKTVILLIVCVFALSGCSNTSDAVTREEYENVVAEVEDLKSQIESLENDIGANVEISDSTINTENLEPVIPDEESSKERVWLRDFSFEYDENNRIYISLYQDGERNIYLNGYGVYEEENLSLLQYERSIGFCRWINLLGNEGHSIDLVFTVGDEEYSLIYSDGELTSDTVPLDSWDYGTFLTSKKYAADKLNAFKEFDKFIHNE